MTVTCIASDVSGKPQAAVVAPRHHDFCTIPAIRPSTSSNSFFLFFSSPSPGPLTHLEGCRSWRFRQVGPRVVDSLYIDVACRGVYRRLHPRAPHQAERRRHWHCCGGRQEWQQLKQQDSYQQGSRRHFLAAPSRLLDHAVLALTSFYAELCWPNVGQPTVDEFSAWRPTCCTRVKADLATIAAGTLESGF